jgi:hypothetical protein
VADCDAIPAIEGHTRWDCIPAYEIVGDMLFLAVNPQPSTVNPFRRGGSAGTPPIADTLREQSILSLAQRRPLRGHVSFSR